MSINAIVDGGEGILYVSTDDGRLLYYRDEARDGTWQWSFGGIGQQIGTGWNVFRHVISGDDGILYAIDQSGDLLYYRDEARNGNGIWSFGGVGQRIGQGWGGVRHVFSGGGGIIYAINPAGDLLYFRDEARDGTSAWSFGGQPRQIGTGWTTVRQVISGGDGIIYAINEAGDLMYYRDEARNGNGVWSHGGIGQRIGTDWNRLRRIVSGGDGIIYAVTASNDLLYYRDEARDGTWRWSHGGVGRKVGTRWDAVTPDFQITTRLGACVVSFGGAARGTTLAAAWVRNAFAEGDGISGYFERMSGGRQRFEAEAYGPFEVMTIAEKAAADNAGGAVPLIAALRSGAQAQGVPVDRLDRIIWIIDDGISTLGTTPGTRVDSLLGAKDFTPQNAMHEMTHAVGVGCHADAATYDDYGNSFCIMGSSRGARGFDDPRLGLSLAPAGIGIDLSHALSGPGLCAPYLYTAGWLDTVANTTTLPRHPASGSRFTLDANQGAPRHGSARRIALTLGDLPQQPGDPSQYWIEYRHPSGFDRNIDRPAPDASPDYPPEGLLVVHEVQFLAARCVDLHAYLRDTVAATVGMTLTVKQGLSLRVDQVDTTRRSVELSAVPSRAVSHAHQDQP